MNLMPDIEATIRSLSVDQVTAEVARAFDAVGVSCILSKAPCWRHGCTETGRRTRMRSDLLVSPKDRIRAERALTGLGFVKRRDDRDTPGWQQAAHYWKRASDRTNADLHRTLPGAGVGEEELWTSLAATSEPIRIGRADVRAAACDHAESASRRRGPHGGGSSGKSCSSLLTAISTRDGRGGALQRAD